MRISELKELLEDADEDAEVFIVEYGYRSSNMVTVDTAVLFEDERTDDDWGHKKENTGYQNVYILAGGTASNRYPPPGIRAEFGMD